jgi:hypothetical protein
MLSQHHLQDIALYLVFLAGQSLYIVKRAGFSVRAGRAKSRRDYLVRNWDILLFRTVLEFIVVYMPARHYSPGDLLRIFHVDIGGFESLAKLNSPIDSAEAFLGIGIASDGLFDWLVDWASRSSKVPDAIKKWLAENVTPIAADATQKP